MSVRDNWRRYYWRHRERVLERHRVRNAAKRGVKANPSHLLAKKLSRQLRVSIGTARAVMAAEDGTYEALSDDVLAPAGEGATRRASRRHDLETDDDPRSACI